MMIWGNKHYVIDKIIRDNGFDNVRSRISDIIWGSEPIEKRWDIFHKQVKGMGPAMVSEILCNTHPNKYLLWNRRAYVGLRYLGVNDLPRYNYQLTGKVYIKLGQIGQTIAAELQKAGMKDANLLTVDYFIWDELQVENNLSQIFTKSEIEEKDIKPVEKEKAQSLHDELRDKLADIGEWLGFKTYTEIKVAEGSKVDTIWEATIGNMGRVIYVFEVQSKGSIDSLIINLLKAMNNPAVQGVVAVSDAEQLNRIKLYAENVADLHKKLRYWDSKEVLQVHDSLEEVNGIINSLGLVPAGF